MTLIEPEKKVPSRSVSNTELCMGLVRIPVKIYKTQDEIGLSGETFHDGCSKDGLSDGKIRQPKICEEHPDLDFPATYSGMRIGEKIVRLTPDVKRSLLLGDCPFEVVSMHKLSHIWSLMMEDQLLIHSNYEICPADHLQESTFHTLMDRLRIKKRFLLLTGPVGKTKRYLMLLPNARLFALYYEEEVRARKNSVDEFETTPTIRKQMDDYLDSFESDFPVLSGQEIIYRIESWYNAHESDEMIKASKTNIFTGENVVT